MLGVLGVGVGVLAWSRGRLARVLVALSPLLVFVLGLPVALATPPCADFLDGPCEENWASGTAAVLGYLVLPFSLVAVATMALTAVFSAFRHRKR